MAEEHWNYLQNRQGPLLMSMVGAALATMPRHEGALRGSSSSDSSPEFRTIAQNILEQIPEQILDSGEPPNTLWTYIWSTERKARTVFESIAIQLTMTAFTKMVSAMQTVLTESCRKRRLGNIADDKKDLKQDMPAHPNSPWNRVFGANDQTAETHTHRSSKQRRQQRQCNYTHATNYEIRLTIQRQRHTDKNSDPSDDRAIQHRPNTERWKVI